MLANLGLTPISSNAKKRKTEVISHFRSMAEDMGLDRPLRSARVLFPYRLIQAAADQRLLDGSLDRLTYTSALTGPSPIFF